ncbi:MAG: hypothetical protein M0Z53_01830 [Thermaerobacter sp.]|nr:hypothetical protein [Thermaerobacter sp.]
MADPADDGARDAPDDDAAGDADAVGAAWAVDDEDGVPVAEDAAVVEGVDAEDIVVAGAVEEGAGDGGVEELVAEELGEPDALEVEPVVDPVEPPVIPEGFTPPTSDGAKFSASILLTSVALYCTPGPNALSPKSVLDTLL